MSIPGNNLLAEYYAQNQGLPFGYEAVEYITSDGHAYINTEVAGGNSDLRITSDFHMTFAPYRCLFIAYVNESTNSTRLICRDNSYGALMYANLNTRAEVATTIGSYSAYYWTNVYIDYNTVKMDNVISNMRHINGVALNRNITVLGPTSSNFSNVSIKTFNIYDNDTLIRNFIPCVRKSDGKPGLYDLCKSICPLTGTPFYINAGTGEFVTP